MLRRERRRGGRGDRVKEEAASGWRHRRWLHWHRRRETLQFLLLFFFTGPRRTLFSSSAFIALIILSGRPGTRELTLSKKFFAERVRAWGKGILGRVRGGGREMRDQDSRCGSRVAAVRAQCGKDL